MLLLARSRSTTTWQNPHSLPKANRPRFRTDEFSTRPAPPTSIHAMTAWADIQRYCDAIAREFNPQRIVVFGSYAYGKPTADSDVDVLVIMPHTNKNRERPSLEIRRRISAGFPVDIVVREPKDIAHRLDTGDSFITEVMTRGRILYEAKHA